jgi:hypothetical protein
VSSEVDPPDRPAGGGRPEDDGILPDGRASGLLVGAALVVVAAGILLRFWTRSDMWLDEALTVNIARLPIGQIAPALRHDGSPPLYYYLLHYWMLWFGTGNLAVRSLSGVLGVLSLPLAWLCGRRLGRRTVAWSTLLLFASSPFAVRYSTENRMYMLIVVLTLVGYLLLDSALKRPSPLRLGAVTLVTGLLLLSHYWTLVLVGAVLVLLAWRVWRRPGERGAPWTLLAVVAGFLFLMPWASILWFQLRHTGTPWSQPASFSAMVNAVSDFAGGGTNEGRALGLLFFGLAGLGLFGQARDRLRIELDLRTRRPARGVAFITAATLALAIVAGFALRSAFTQRYAAVVLAPFLLLVSLGLTTFVDRRIRLGVLTAAVAFGLAGAATNVTTNRTQAGVVASAIKAGARPGDVVAYCPDQLGPSVSRLLGPDYDQITFPRGTGPRRVDWVDYAKVNQASNPSEFAHRLVAAAGRTHSIWLVWSSDYRTFEGKCEALESAVAAMRPHSAALVQLNTTDYFEHASLDRFWPS